MENDDDIEELLRSAALRTSNSRNVRLQARLIDDLLDLTRLARGKIELQLEPVDLHELLRNTLEIVNEDIAYKQLVVVTDLAAQAYVAAADPIRIQQVFWNLLNNAVKFTPKAGRIGIRSWNNDDLRASLESGFDYHLTKPVEFQKLESVLREIGASSL